MSISSVVSCVLLACLLLQLGGEAFAQNSQIRSEIDARTWEAEAADLAPWSVSPDEKEKKYILVPVPIIDPTIGNGLALAGLYTFAPSDDAGDQPKERRSTVAVGAGYTNTDSWMVGGGLKLYLDEDRYRVKLATGYANMNLKWFGTSSDSPFFDNPINFRTRGGMIDANVEKRLTDHFFLGVSGRYIRPTASVKIPFPELPQPKLTFNLTAIGAIADYDSRDNTWYPTSGSLGVANALAYLEALGSDREFATLDATFAVYRKLAEPLVLAGEARVATVGENTPFFMLSTVNLRGFPRGQYMNRTVTQVQAELRWEAWRRFGAVFFGGTGVATRSLDEWGDADRAYGYGAGVRYRVSEVDKMNVGLDVATGSTDDFTVYFRIGEAF
jgi:outer membrane protein assembly factor BamA